MLVDGAPDPELDRFSALEQMKPGDVYIKGANALNYRPESRASRIGHPTGGTIGGAIGTIIGSKLRLLIPVGLEKEVPFDIQEASGLIAEPDEHLGSIHSLWPVRGIIFTEIEALGTSAASRPIPSAPVASRAPRAACACSWPASRRGA